MRQFVIATLAALVPAAAVAQSAPPIAYPQKVVTLVTHSSPGGGSDIFMRELAKHLPRHLAATFIVDNVQGGSGARAMTKVATAKPDGATFYAITPTYVFTSLLSKPPHTYKDLQPVALVFADPEVLYTRADGPFKSVKDVIDRARAARGRWGVANPASLERQAAERLKTAAGVNAAIVSHEGGGDLMINVLNGTLDAGVGEIAELRAQLEARKVHLLGTFSASRIAAFPELPTVKESGFDVTVRKFRGLAGPRGLPPEITDAWHQALTRLLADPAYQKVYEAESLIVDLMPTAQAQAAVDAFGREAEEFFAKTGGIKK